MTHAKILLLAVAAVVAVALGTSDRDAGGYRDGLLTEAQFPDKFVHAVVALALFFLVWTTGIGPSAAVLCVVVAGVGYEIGQSRDGGYFSRWDVLADVVGALAGWMWVAAVRHA